MLFNSYNSYGNYCSYIYIVVNPNHYTAKQTFFCMAVQKTRFQKNLQGDKMRKILLIDLTCFLTEHVVVKKIGGVND